MNKVENDSTSSKYDGINFNKADIEREVHNFIKVSKSFLSSDSEDVINEWLAKLKSFMDKPTKDTCKWDISEQNPIITNKTKDYETNNRTGGIYIQGTLSSVWEICQIPSKKGKKSTKLFRLTGLASTKIKIKDVSKESQPKTIAQWQFEVGDANSPGCHFHLGIGQFGMDSALLPVPRFPSILITPIDALDFLLGEIFQTKWKEQVNGDSGAMNEWSNIQKKRMSSLMKWKSQIIEGSSGSAWNYLKHQKPDSNIFLDSKS